MKKTVWIDLTDMLGWNGSFGGTQRVVYGIANQYFITAQSDKQNKYDLRFFYFDEQKRNFFETSFDPILKKHSQLYDQEKVSIPEIGKKARLKSLVLRYTPQFVLENPRAKRYALGLVRGAQYTYRKTRQLSSTLSRKSNDGAYDAKLAVFNANDIVLLPGKPWDSPLMMPAIASLKAKNNFKVVTVIYDLIISLYPQLHTPVLFKDYTRFLFYAAQCSDLVLPISKSSQDDLYEFCDRLNLPKPKSTVIRIGDVIEEVKDPVLPRGFERYEEDRFLLCVGTIEVRKNHTLLYYAYKLAQERGINLPRLVMVGRPGWGASDIYELIKNDPRINGEILILENVNDAELSWLYRNCLFTVYPSMYEGWGLPVAESLQYGKVAVTSQASSIPEIAGNILEYFSPFSVDECLHLILKYLDNDRRSETERKIRNNFTGTTWNKTYKQVTRAVENL